MSDADPPVVFKKPSRPKGNVRKRAAEAPPEQGDGDPAGGSGPSGSLEMMRELQRQRQRVKGVTLEARGLADAVDEALAAEGKGEAEANHSLDATFTSQTEGGEVDQNMLKYIEEQMQRSGAPAGDGLAAQSASHSAPLDPEEEGLYALRLSLRDKRHDPVPARRLPGAVLEPARSLPSPGTTSPRGASTPPPTGASAYLRSGRQHAHR